MAQIKFPSNDGQHVTNLNSPSELTENRSVDFPDASGTIPVTENKHSSLEDVIGKRYIATLFQSGTADPIPTVLTPLTGSLSGIVWTRREPRIYDGTLANAFTLNGSTELIMRNTVDLVSFEVTDVNTVTIEMADDDTLSNRRIEINVL